MFLTEEDDAIWERLKMDADVRMYYLAAVQDRWTMWRDARIVSSLGMKHYRKALESGYNSTSLALACAASIVEKGDD